MQHHTGLPLAHPARLTYVNKTTGLNENIRDAELNLCLTPGRVFGHRTRLI